ncbi:MFS transporter [Paenibacillus sp. 8b26]|uniref:MFS transporter n=1 Tax=Paenibacillus sp. 8b26 TaxID=3424133 RepID=UPI003D6525A6
MNSVPHVQKAPNPKHFWTLVLCGTLLVITTTGLARMGYGAVLPYMQKGLHLTISQTGLLGTIMFLGYLLTVGLSGVLAVRWGAKLVLITGSAAVVVSMLGLAWSPSFWAIGLFMFVIGAGSSLVFTPLMSLMIGWFPQQRGKVLGILLSGAGIGMLLSGFLIPVIIRVFPHDGWRAVWLCFGIISLVVLVLSLFVLKNPASARQTVSEEDKPQWLKNKELTRIAVLYFLIGMAYLIPNLYQSSYMLEAGISSSTTGLIYAFAGVFSIIGGPVWGSISDKAGVQRTFMLAWIFAVLGDLVPIVMDNVWGFAISSIIWGSSIGGLVTLIQVKASQQVPSKYVPSAIGFVSVFYAVGQMLGPALSGWMIEHMGGFAAAYSLGAVVYALGFVLNSRGKVVSVQSERSSL